MRASLGLLFTMVLVALGCRSPQAVSDPFLNSRIPPPPTGQIGPVATGVYGSAPPPAAAVPGSPYAPPNGNFNYQGGTLTPVAPQPATGAPLTAPPVYNPNPSPASIPSAPVAAPPPSYTPPGRMQYPPQSQFSPTTSLNGPAPNSIQDRGAIAKEVRPLAETSSKTRLASAAGTSTWDRADEPNEQGIDPPQELVDLPEARPLRDPRDTRQIEPASYSVPQGAPARQVLGAYASGDPPREDDSANAPAGAGRTRPITSGSGPADGGATYGYDASYAWLQGQLEYSEATKQWKLRYIPIDGPTDRFGGSVVLAPTASLAGLRPGSFVSIKGQLDGGGASQGTYAPLYRVTSVERLSD